MNKLNITLKGNGRSLEIRNPVMTASGTFGYGKEYLPFGDLGILGAIIGKGISLQPREGNPMPRIAETHSGMLNSIGLQNCGVELFLQNRLPEIKTYDVPFIANLYGTSTTEFAELAKRLSDQEGIAGFEVNISCPNVKEGGAIFGQDPAMAAKVTEAVVNATGPKPVIVKLSPNVTDISLIAKACEEAGATILSCINTVSGLGIDLDNRKPLLATAIGGLSGPAIKPIALRCVWEVCNAVSIPVIGIGGIQSVEDVLEFILAGAHAVQIGTANFTRPDTAFRIVQELPAAIRKYEITSWDSFRGSLQFVQPRS